MMVSGCQMFSSRATPTLLLRLRCRFIRRCFAAAIVLFLRRWLPAFSHDYFHYAAAALLLIIFRFHTLPLTLC